MAIQTSSPPKWQQQANCKKFVTTCCQPELCDALSVQTSFVTYSRRLHLTGLTLGVLALASSPANSPNPSANSEQGQERLTYAQDPALLYPANPICPCIRPQLTCILKR